MRIKAFSECHPPREKRLGTPCSLTLIGMIIPPIATKKKIFPQLEVGFYPQIMLTEIKTLLDSLTRNLKRLRNHRTRQ